MNRVVKRIQVTPSGVTFISPDEKIFFARGELLSLVNSLEFCIPMNVDIFSNRGKKRAYKVRFKQFKDHLRIKLQSSQVKIKNKQPVLTLLKLQLLDYSEGSFNV